MAHCNTILSQMLRNIPRHEFETLAKKHHTGRSFRTASRWSQFVVMAIGQLSGRKSLRDVIDNVGAQQQRLYHCGIAKLSRSNLSRINEDKPHQLYEELFGKLLKRFKSSAPGHGFRFKNELYSMDASTIDLCLSVFPWARFRKNKAGIQLNVAMNHRGNLPEFITVSDARQHEVSEGRKVNFPKGSIVAVDRGYTDYAWYEELTNKGVFFVSRLKKNAKYRVVERHKLPNKNSGVTSDHTIEFTGTVTAARCPSHLRRVGFKDPESGKRYVFLTNNMSLAASTIAAIYKARWQIELFFKWIKQNLKIKSFMGTSKNAVLTQIWIAMIVYLLIAYLKFTSKTKRSMMEILRLLETNLFEKRELDDIVSGKAIEKIPINPNQMFLGLVS